MGPAARQRELMARIIAHYHGYLRQPPIEWEHMPMLPEGAPEFTKRFPEAAAIFDNLHMLHDNVDDVLSSPERYPTPQAKREAILRILPIYLHRNHAPKDRYTDYHGMMMAGGHAMMQMGPRPPSAKDVLEGRTRQQEPGATMPGKEPGGEHEGHEKK